ncbi:hypothetical protein GJ496_006196 [Pomphorhynchus laevis]|nr:hypothetical protein GJ496_006196 [Pomphorhynchus laevis]
MLIDRTNKPQQRLSHCPVITPMYESRPEISFPIALPTMHNYQSLGDQPMFPPLLPPSFFQGQHCPPGSSSSMLIANLANPQHQQTAFMLNRILMQNFFISSANKPGNC